MRILTIGVCACAGMACVASGATIQPGTYELFNHPDGSSNPPPYGLRLDGLIGGDANDVFTWDFEHDDASMLLTYDDDAGTVEISGSAFGGLTDGDGYAPGAGVWTIDVLIGGVGLVPGDDDLWSTSDGASIGSITSPGGDAFALYGESGNFGHSFRLGDEDNDNGHRGAPGVSGWGWISHREPNSYVPYSDWLFRIGETPVPAPGALLVLATGGLLAVRRRPG